MIPGGLPVAIQVARIKREREGKSGLVIRSGMPSTLYTSRRSIQ